jgi:hypothetical protein
VRVVEASRDGSFATKGVAFSNEELVRRVAAYEALTEDLGRAAAVIGYWSESADPRLLPWLVQRLANAVERGGSPHRSLTSVSRFAARRSCSWRADRPATPASISGGPGAGAVGHETQWIERVARS